MARRRFRSLLVVAVLALTLAGCDGGTTTTVTSHKVVTRGGGGGGGGGAQAASGPHGSLDFDAVGEVGQGSSTTDARQAFGPPDQTRHAPGCELSASSPEQVVWTYGLPDGDLTLNFGASDDALISYRTTSRELPTVQGNRVGDDFGAVRDSWGSALQPLNLGQPATPQAGFWYVKHGPRSQLTFAIAGGRVTSISGGYTPPCE